MLKTKIYVKDVESAIFAMSIGLKRERERKVFLGNKKCQEWKLQVGRSESCQKKFNNECV